MKKYKITTGKLHMLGLGRKTACGRKLDNSVSYVPFSAQGYKMVTCKSCKKKVKKVLGF